MINQRLGAEVDYTIKASTQGRRRSPQSAGGDGASVESITSAQPDGNNPYEGEWPKPGSCRHPCRYLIDLFVLGYISLCGIELQRMLDAQACFQPGQRFS
jgi:hypothetical protein